MKKFVTLAALSLASVFVVGGLAAPEPARASEAPEAASLSSEPEPAGSCYGVRPICIGGKNLCCLCGIGGINCNWGCC